MGPKPIAKLESMVGETVGTAENLRVEAGKVAEFAHAVTDDNPLFHDAAVASDRGFESIPAPLTFTRIAEFPRYRPDAFVGRFGFDLGFDLGSTLHGQQSYEYERHPRVGDVLSAVGTLTDVFQRDGRRGGTLTFAVIEEEFVDEDGEPVLTTETVQIYTDRTPASESPESEPTDGRSASDGTPDATLSTEPLTRTDFVKYAGASGDFARVHYDEPYTVSQGYDSVFAQGMLTAGVASRFVTGWLGLDRIRRFRTRFVGQVWPGESLEAVGWRRSDGADDESAEFEIRTDDGRRVLAGRVGLREA